MPHVEGPIGSSATFLSACAPPFLWSEFLVQMLRSFCFRCHSSMCYGFIKCKRRRWLCLLPMREEAVLGPGPVFPASTAMKQNLNRPPRKCPTRTRKLGVHPGLSFPTGETVSSRETSHQWVMPALSVCSCSSYPYRGIHLGICSSEGASESPCVLGFFQWYLVLE